MIYRAADKNRGRLNCRLMNSFCSFINDTELQELQLRGRRFTWSNERDSPTLERLDHVFASEHWLLAFPNHDLSTLSSKCSDHALLLLKLDCSLPHFKRFHFENFWPQCSGFTQVVEEARHHTKLGGQVDVMRGLNAKFRQTAQALKRWSAKHVGSVRIGHCEGNCSPPRFGSRSSPSLSG